MILCLFFFLFFSQTPLGTVLPSTRFKGDHFSLLLPAPVEGGSYTCRVPANSTAPTCLQDGNQGQATGLVDSVKARVAVLEGQHNALQQENALLKAENERLKETDAELLQADVNFTQLYQTLKNRIQQVEGT